MAPTTSILGTVVSVVAIASATVALCLGHIDGEAYVALIAGFGGVGVGAGAHAAGVSQRQP